TPRESVVAVPEPMANLSPSVTMGDFIVAGSIWIQLARGELHLELLPVVMEAAVNLLGVGGKTAPLALVRMEV
ncbi:MAG: hypothetical protein ACTSPX_03215, partial [Candidatus Thorarchaeota archaeon]